MERRLYKRISLEEFLEHRNRPRCPDRAGLNISMCGLKIGKYDCKTCWEIALKGIKTVEVIYQLEGFEFLKEGE